MRRLCTLFRLPPSLMWGSKASRDLRQDVEEGLADALESLTLRGGAAASSSRRHQAAHPGGRADSQAAEAAGGLKAGGSAWLGFAIGGCWFDSVAEAREYVNQLKERRLDQLITPSDPDWPFLSALLARHPRAGAAVQPVPRSPPVTAFVVRRHRSVQTELRYIDDRGEIDFSALKCLRGDSLEADLQRRLKSAMAEAVADQLHAFKSSKHKSRSKRRCDLCGAKQGLGVDCQPGGRPAIAAAFLSSTQLTAPEEFHSNPVTHAPIFTPADQEFADAWRAYFTQHARLRLLCQACRSASVSERAQAAAAAAQG
ncbi:hypothetical protein COHA_008435 [Chlorella ohadii]|uniref:Uncharacterized protein n=1 Tax=Chlorella ohadii TaxID=2649997 RepID=A0AAD5DHJ5_9CHLO|nr:hypothetical protein COHA_008435 [Chlorella ohadii]